MNADTTQMFYRLDENGNARILMIKDGDFVTRIDSRVWPIGSDLSAGYDHLEGIVLSIADAESIGIRSEGEVE